MFAATALVENGGLIGLLGAQVGIGIFKKVLHVILLCSKG